MIMTPLDLQSERYSATGNVASEGLLNQLGRPNLNILTVLIRETVQNSWDARIADNKPVNFGILARTLKDNQIQLLSQVIFANHFDHSKLNDALSSTTKFQVMIVYDRGTTGLGGPTRADRITDENEPCNFVNFLRNVGIPSNKQLSGGTFGYGKAALFLASSLRTICVHTHCYSKGKLESRFIAAALGPRYEVRGLEKERSQYTGRHWWGRSEEDIVEPLQGFEADRIANLLGFPDFVDDECGTSIMILLPAFGEHSLLENLQLAGTHILWNCWPKMLETIQNEPSIKFDLVYENQPILIPNPHEFPPLQGFAQAMENLKSLSLSNKDTIVTAQDPASQAMGNGVP